MECETNIFYVYVHRKSDNNDVFYIGKGKGKRAYSRHGRSVWWKSTVAKHGFTCEIVEKGLSEQSAFDLEIELIKFYRECGYKLCNMTDGGQGMSGNIASAETRAKLSARFKGRELSEEWRNKLSISRKGWIPSEETRQKLREHNLGKTQSKETIDKRREKLKRAVKCSNGLVFASVMEAMRWLIDKGLCPPSRTYPTGISACCSGKRPVSYGFGWEHYKGEVMKKLYSYSESGRGWEIEGMFVSNDESLKAIYGKSLYYGECAGKHSEITMKFEEGGFTVVTEDQDFIVKYEELIGYTGYNPFHYLPDYDEDECNEDEE